MYQIFPLRNRLFSIKILCTKFKNSFSIFGNQTGFCFFLSLQQKNIYHFAAKIKIYKSNWTKLGKSLAKLYLKECLTTETNILWTWNTFLHSVHGKLLCVCTWLHHNVMVANRIWTLSSLIQDWNKSILGGKGYTLAGKRFHNLDTLGTNERQSWLLYNEQEYSG